MQSWLLSHVKQDILADPPPLRLIVAVNDENVKKKKKVVKAPTPEVSSLGKRDFIKVCFESFCF